MIGIEPPGLSTAPVGTEGGDQRVWRFVLVSDGKSTLGDNGGVDQAEWSSPSQNRAELSMDIEPPSLSTAPVGTEDGDQRYICVYTLLIVNAEVQFRPAAGATARWNTLCVSRGAIRSRAASIPSSPSTRARSCLARVPTHNARAAG